ncbi:MAG TPA: hypothetical protein VI758_04710, partial [Bacteroidota bacterium]
SREHHVKNDAADMEMFYTASLAHGLKGFNYYMFSQGINQRGKGVFGKTFYFQTPLDATARKSPLFDVAKTVGRFIRREGEDLLKSSTAPQLCVAYYKPYYYTDMTSSQLLRERKLAVEKLGLTLDPRFVREHLLFDGALRALQTLNINYDIRDLQNSKVDALLKYRQLWVVTTEFMDKETQEFLLAYVKRGGHLVIFPAMPTLDDYLGDCTVLCDGLGLHVGKIIAPNKVDALGIEDVYSTLKEQQEFVVSEREAIAHTKTGKVNGIRRKVGGGTVTVLGFAFGYTTDEHLQLFEKIAGLGGVKSDRKASDPDIQVVVRHGRKHSYMFLLNYHNATKAFTVASKRYSLRPFSCKVVRIN